MPPQESANRSSRLSVSSQSSTSSITKQEATTRETHPQSPSAASLGTSQKGQNQKAHSRHVVGHGRAHPRPPSYGKNLNKLAKVVQDHGEGTTSVVKHHHRSHSHTPSTSPRPSYTKRAGSSAALPRNGSQVSLKKNQSHVSLKKNHSSVSLKRNDTKPELKQKLPRPDPVLRRSLTQPKNTSVRFDLGGNDGNPDDSGGWTEASSATESPSATRPSTSSRNPTPALRASPAQSPRMPDSPPASLPRDIPPHLGPRPPRQEPTGHLRSTPPSADAITTRLLQRSSSRTAAPKMSTFSASATPGNRSPRSYASTLNTMETGSLSPDSGRSADGPPSANRPISKPRAPHYSPVNGAAAPLSSSLPQTSNPTRLYRTQQKIMLQRASTTIESHTGSHGLSTRSALPVAIVNDGRDMLRVWERAGAEYGVVRRWRSPVQEAVKRNVKGRVGIATAPRKSEDERRMGLSQSLREGITSAPRKEMAHSAGSKDDSALVAREVENEDDEADDMSLDTLLQRMWDRADIPIDRE